MYILVVEDMQERINWFAKEFAGHDIIFEKRPARAKRFIIEKKFDIIFFDHDLGDHVLMDSGDELTGYQVALVVPMTRNNKTPCVVHSWNPVGAKNIYDSLKKNGVPVIIRVFGSFDKSILDNIPRSQ